MAIPLRTPRVNNNDDAVRLLRVLVKQGDAVSAGDVVAEIETDKSSFTVEAEHPGFVLAVLPQINDLIDVGSVLLWLGATPDDAVPEAAAQPEHPEIASAPTVKAAQLLEQYGLTTTDVQASDGRLSARDVEEHVRVRGLRPVDSVQQPPVERSGAGPAVAGTSRRLTPEERGMLRTVLWQRQEAVPAYVEIEYDVDRVGSAVCGLPEAGTAALESAARADGLSLDQDRQGEPAVDLDDRRRSAVDLRCREPRVHGAKRDHVVPGGRGERSSAVVRRIHRASH